MSKGCRCACLCSQGAVRSVIDAGGVDWNRANDAIMDPRQSRVMAVWTAVVLAITFLLWLYGPPSTPTPSELVRVSVADSKGEMVVCGKLEGESSTQL